VTLAYLKGKDAESEEAHEHASSSSLALYADCAARSRSGCPITFDRHRAFSRPDPVGDPVPIELDSVTDANMRQAALASPLTEGFRMKSQDSLRSLTLSRPGLLSSSFWRNFGAMQQR
jgi:hypothetical protein